MQDRSRFSRDGDLQLDGREHHAARHQVRKQDEEDAAGEQVRSLIDGLFYLSEQYTKKWSIIWDFLFL